MDLTSPLHRGTRSGPVAAAILGLSLAACSPAELPESVPPGGADLTLYVRNASETQAHITIEFGPDGGAARDIGFGKTTGIACDVMPAESSVALMDGPLVNGVQPNVKAPIFEATGVETQSVRWLDIDAAGTAAVGEGVPDWWSGPPTC